MILVRDKPKLEFDGVGRWSLTVWAGRAFDYDAPLRAVVEAAAEVLVEQAAFIVLPPWTEGEDFIEGAIHCGKATIDVYFEYALGYVGFSCTERFLLKGLRLGLATMIELSPNLKD